MGMETNNMFRRKNSSSINGYKKVNTRFLSFFVNNKILSPGLKFYFFYLFYGYYNFLLINYFIKKKFDYIVLTSDWFHSSKSIASSKNLSKKILLIQPCYLDLLERIKSIKIYKLRLKIFSSIKSFLRKIIFNQDPKFLHPILKIEETRFGFINKKSRLLIWDENLSEYYEKINRKFELISNPIYKSLYNKYKLNTLKK